MIPIALDPEATFPIPIPGGPTFACRYMSLAERDRYEGEIRKWPELVSKCTETEEAAIEAYHRGVIWSTLSKYLRGWDRHESLSVDPLFESLTPGQFRQLIARCGDDQYLTEDHRKNSESPGSSSLGGSANGVGQGAPVPVFAMGRSN